MSSNYVLKQTRDGKFTFTLQSHHGKVIFTSNAYVDKDSALRAINAARQFARRESCYEFVRTDLGLVYFVLKDAKGKVLGRSRKYIDVESSRAGVYLAKSKTRGARLEDLTDTK
jgi:uncharacterized protein YegP (UPF0339 family)